ncbi:protein TASOR-like isoform X2 [Gymnodraco acuticeps]|uniref:Protein TASOR-like isoform X2 n=1 Tax=Gymnodraco acuticeps TaxID=8218 RepID=A0A6P8U3U6_GYMAC|nr:protein TASOR-like isoform X2 [Gymnodraco acuticeps]
MCVVSSPLCTARPGGNSGVTAGLKPRNSDTLTVDKRRVVVVKKPTMEENLIRREAARPPRRASAAAAEVGANDSLQDGEVYTAWESQAGPERLGAAAGRAERRSCAPLAVHHRHMPMGLLNIPIPRKKENRALFQDVSTESREYEDMMTILTSSYIDTGSAGGFTYCKPRLVHSELLEREFVEKRKEMKADGRTDKELEESYCFLLAENAKLPALCEKGLQVGQSWITVLGNPTKGVYLSKYSDLLQVNPINPGFTGDIVIFKVMKGKVKSIYENMKNLLDPTPRFDSHTSKNASKVTSLSSYRALELTQQYFYEYSFDELRPRPRQVCPYAVISFLFKGKDSSLPSKPLAPIRLNSQSAEASKERAQFTVWNGDLVKGDRLLFQISLRCFSPPLLPHRLPEKLEMGCVMRLEQLTRYLSSDLLSYNLYSSSHQVVNSGHCCSLLEVTDRNRSTTSVTGLLQELETKRVVLVTALSDRGFLLLLSSVQMAMPPEREENWKRSLQALFVFPESRDLSKSTFRGASSSHNASQSGSPVMPRLSQFIPALHHALVKARANHPPELSAGVEHLTREYLVGLTDGKVRQYPMGEYDSKLDECMKLFPAPKQHRVNMEGYLRSYLYTPALHLLSVARAKQMVEAHCGPEESQEANLRRSLGGHREVMGKEATSNSREGQTNTQKMQQLVDLVLTCKRKAETVVRKEGGEGGVKVHGRKRKMEQETAERTLKFLKASQEPGRHSKFPVEGSHIPAPPGSLGSLIGSVGLMDVDLREDGSELATRLLSLLKGLTQAARGTSNQSEVQEVVQKTSWPFDRLATKLGLPTNCDIDLRDQEELETIVSISSSEGFSPGSHSGEGNHHGAAGRGGGLGKRAGGYEEEEEEQDKIPWVLIPITGLSYSRYTHRDRKLPQDPRFHHLTTATTITTTSKPPGQSPSPSPRQSTPPSPLRCASPEPSPPHSISLCPSPDPSPPPSPSQCPSPEPSPPTSPSQCPSPEPSPPPSPPKCPSPQCRPTQRLDPRLLGRPPLPSAEPNDLSQFNSNHRCANVEPVVHPPSRESAGPYKDREKTPQGKEKKNEEPFISTSIQPSVPPAPERRRSPSPPPTQPDGEGVVKEVQADVSEEVEIVNILKKRVKEDQEEEVEFMDVEVEVGEVKDLVGGPLFSPPVAVPPTCLDSVVDKHLGNFSSDVQLLLQKQSIHYSFPQFPHSTSNTETSAPHHTLPHASMSQLSHYVSFYNPCSPVHDPVVPLTHDFNRIFEDTCPSHKPGSSRTNVDDALASRISEFVSSIRASKAPTSGEDDGIFGELTAADVSTNPALSRGSDPWQQHTIPKHVPDATGNISPMLSSHVSLSVTTAPSDSAYKLANTSVLIPAPNKPPHSHWKQQSHSLEINRTHNIRQTKEDWTEHCSVEMGGSSLAGTKYEGSLPGFSCVSEPVSASVPGPTPTPPASALSSLISQLQPEVFNSLVKIIKEVKRNTLQFYLHSMEPGDQVHQEVKANLLKQGNAEQSPMAFLNQENAADRLLVVIQNQDIAGYIHKIPGLVSLKRLDSVVFVGIDTLDDIKNNSYNELFVSGGCIISDELILNPDFITHDRLTALLMLLEQNSSPESVWRLKVHCKTHKKLKEQSRFRRDAANLLDVLSAYQKRQIVEFLPYHNCDMMNLQSPDLVCLLELQARYTQFRHTVFLTEHNFEKFPDHSNSGIIVASFEEILHDFGRLVGHHDIKKRQPIIDDVLSPKEHIPSLSSHDQPQHLHQQPDFIPPALSHLSDQLVPDASCKEGVPLHSETDYEVLRRAISQLRAERQLASQAELSLHSLKNFPVNVVPTGSGPTSPPLPQKGLTESVQVTQDRKAVAATLELIHSALKQETMEEEKRQGGAATLTEGQRRGGGEAGGHRDGPPVRVVGALGGSQDPRNTDTSTPSSNQSKAVVTGLSSQTHATDDGKEKADQQGEPLFPEAATSSAASSSTTACPVGDRSRDVVREQPIRGDAAPTGTASVTKAITRGEDGLDHDTTHASSTTCSQKEMDFTQSGNTSNCAIVTAGMEFSKKFPHSCSARPSQTPKRKPHTRSRYRPFPPVQHGHAESSPLLITLDWPSALPEDIPSCSRRLSQSLQLYSHTGKKYSYRELSNPMVWKKITYARPGWTPEFPPFLKPGNQYLELKANSMVVFTSMAPPHGKGPNRLASGVTCYDHKEGPWCEVQSQDGARICILAVSPQHTSTPIARITPQVRKGPPGQNVKEETVLEDSSEQESIMPVLPT